MLYSGMAKKTSEFGRRHAAFRWFLPFNTIASNVLGFIGNRTPILGQYLRRKDIKRLVELRTRYGLKTLEVDHKTLNNKSKATGIYGWWFNDCWCITWQSNCRVLS